jgi:hypothetical protein
MFSKLKVQKGFPRPERLVSTTAGTRQLPLIRNTAEEPRRKGEVRSGKRGGSYAGNSAYRIANPTAHGLSEIYQGI